VNGSRFARRAGLVVLVMAGVVVSMGAGKKAGTPIPPTAVVADSLIRTGETHFTHLWQLTFGGENAEGYWSSKGDRLIFQSTRDGYPCDREFVMDFATGDTKLVSTGTGRVTCGYFYDNDQRILFASTHLAADSCPPPPDMSMGYVWALYPSFDIFTAKPDGSDLERLTDTPGYDAEATVSVDQKSIVFTSVRDGDIELYSMRPDGSGVTRLTNEPGYDGGAFYSRDGKWICWRRDRLATDSARTAYRELLDRHLVHPSKMDLWVMKADGTGKRQITNKPGASFAPYFTPDGKALIYSSNWETPRGRNFDLYLVSTAGGEPQPITRDEQFDGFPMFSPDGKYLVFASNRGGKQRGETNLFLAEWKK
jgi:Tol biopolymer transport system component